VQPCDRMLMERRPSGLLATLTVAHDLYTAIARAPGGSTVARLPGDRDGARLPWVVQAALGGPGHSDHLASRTQFLVVAPCGWLTAEARTVSLGILQIQASTSSDLGIRFTARDRSSPPETVLNGPLMARAAERAASGTRWRRLRATYVERMTRADHRSRVIHR